MPFGCLLKLWSKFSCCFKNVIHIQCWKLSTPYLPHICLSHFTSYNNRNNNSLQLGSNRLKTTQNAWHGLAEFPSTKCSSASLWSIFSTSLGKHWPSQPMACLRTSSYLSTLKTHTVQRDVSVRAWIWHHPFEMCILICVAFELKSKYCLQTSLLLLSKAYHLYDKKSHQSHHLSHLIDTVFVN
jgi:hypothetical protein